MSGDDKDPQVVLFDFDGVVADSFEAYFTTFASICTEMGYTRINSREAFLKLSEGNPIRQLLWAGFPMFRLKRLFMQFAPRIIEAHQRIRPFAGVPEIVTEIAERYPAYVITSNTAPVVSAFLEKHGVRGIRKVLGSEITPSKVKKIRRVMRDHPKSVTYLVSDTKGDMIEARRAHAVPVAVTWGWHSVAKLHEGRPAHIVDSPAGLRALFLSDSDA